MTTEQLTYKQKGTDTRHEPLNHYTMKDGTVVAITKDLEVRTQTLTLSLNTENLVND